MIIAIDGPAASGKGTLARRLAQKLMLAYLDTGKIYRAVAWLVDKNGVNSSSVDEVLSVLNRFELKLLEEPELNRHDIGVLASKISVYPQVRETLLSLQQNFANNPSRYSSDKVEGAVLDGRDIGTVVCPDADFKFFVTAHVDVRAKRRHKELQERGFDIIYEDVLDDLKSRDERDTNRSIAPLKPAKDAIVIDSTDKNLDDVLDETLAIIKKKFLETEQRFEMSKTASL